MAKTNSDTQVSDLINSTVGLEVETHRINARGELSRHDYPHGLLDEKQHHFIKKLFEISKSGVGKLRQTLKLPSLYWC
ncbi:hypothetical protein QUF07_11715, partial [Lentilactobacillus sp. TOM.63]|nr:hypothetical protein [Lentilactobacillus sp. TOM.63]